MVLHRTHMEPPAWRLGNTPITVRRIRARRRNAAGLYEVRFGSDAPREVPSLELARAVALEMAEAAELVIPEPQA